MVDCLNADDITCFLGNLVALYTFTATVLCGKLGD